MGVRPSWAEMQGSIYLFKGSVMAVVSPVPYLGVLSVTFVLECCPASNTHVSGVLETLAYEENIYGSSSGASLTFFHETLYWWEAETLVFKF